MKRSFETIVRTAYRPAFLMSAEETRIAVLDAAEALLGEVGYAAMSLRSVTQRAKANLASVNYHFGGKEGLARAALKRRGEPVNAERLRRLDLVLAAGRKKPSVREVLEAFVTPVFAMVEQWGPRPAAMVGRLLAEQPPFLRQLFAEEFRVVARRFAEGIARAEPSLSLSDAYWLLHFSIGAMSHTMMQADLLRHLAGPALGRPEPAEIVDRLCAFCAGGIRAAAPESKRPRKARRVAKR